MRSKYEKRIASELDALGVKYEYESHSYNYFIKVPNAKCEDCGGNSYRQGYYTPDFFLSNGVIVETKGRFTAQDRAKMVAVKELHPDLDLRLLFMRDNKLSKWSKTRYSTWAVANGFSYTIGSIPEDWTK